jgi:23S rRNA (adenine2503-C2)-methyltransferase
MRRNTARSIGRLSRTSVTESLPPASSSVGLKALTRTQLAEVLGELGEPAYRTGQIIRWVYGRGASSYDQMTDLPAGLRETLAGRLPLVSQALVAKQVSSLDGTRKYVWRLADGAEVETVGLPTDDRLTVCFSTQAGCAMGCTFCATGAGGLVRDLHAGEMVDQVRLVGEDFGHRVTNSVAMGQGEPFANYAASIEAMRLMNSADGLGIGARHLTVSTCGLISGIRRLAREPEQFTLAVSLHSAVQETRDRLMPGVRGTGLPELREALAEYSQRTRRRVSLEFALIDGVNDTGRELGALVAFCEKLLCHVNLIPANPVADTGWKRSGDARISEFLRSLTARGIQCSVRVERGADIDAACGQLRQRS